MVIKMALKDMLTRQVATSEHSSNQDLITCYFRNDYQTVKNCISEIAKSLDYQIEHVDDHYKEIFLQGKSSHIIISIAQISYYEMAIDLVVHTYWTLSKKKAQKIIALFYQKCQSKLNFKGKGLTR